MFRLLVVVCMIVAGAQAASIQSSLRSKITQSLESFLASQARGVENCENKCDKAFNRFAYEISTSSNPTETFEFRACVRGCDQCTADLASNADKSNCFRTCKDFDWKALGIVKGVIEPDKACIGGCIIQTCQAVCAGGTVDQKKCDEPTPLLAERWMLDQNGAILPAPGLCTLEFTQHGTRRKRRHC
jgi:hypothetical protein